MQDIEQRVPVMDAQYKIITKTAQLITKESSQEEANEMFATMSGLKERLTKVGPPVQDQRCLLLIYSSSSRGQIVFLLPNHAFDSYWGFNLVTLTFSNLVISLKNETMG